MSADQAEIVPPSSSSSAQIPTRPCCSLLYDELTEEYHFSVFDKCRACNNPVACHPRKFLLANPSQSSRGNNETVKCLIRLSSSIPKWTKSTVCHTYLSSLERLLSNHDIPVSEWYRVFAYVTSSDSEAEWIQTHIISPRLSWDESSKLFTKQFRNADYTSNLRHEYRSCKQRKNESVQDYAFRFKSLCTQLDISDSNIDAIDIFVRGLYSNIFREYKRTESQETRAGQGNKHNSLDYVIEVCIDVDVTERTVGLSMDRSQAKPSGDSAKSKYCSFQKTNSHNTIECRTKKSAENNSNNTSSVNSENQNTCPNRNSNYPRITCFTCK